MRIALPSLGALLAPLGLLSLAACGPNLTHPVHDDYAAPQQAPLACTPNLDGRIDANELQAALGVPESMLVSPAGTSRPVDQDGTVDADGHLTWDWGSDYADDQLARLSASALDGKWYASHFPGGQFVTRIDVGGAVEGVYKHDDQALWLLGVASSAEHPPEGQTLLVYDQPVALFRFPITVGANWVSVGEVRNGTIRDLPYAGRDTYQVTVDGSGQLTLPDLVFTQAMRVRTSVTIEPAVGPVVHRQQTSFLFECFGEVARANSADGETNPDFTTAAELRRLSLERNQP